MRPKTFDFSGWATKNDIKCSDGRTIRRNAFAHNDGMTVPLVWNHGYSSPDNIVGNAYLENRKEGVYTYGTFNSTDNGQTAKNLVQHGDITALSIYANHLKQKGGDVLHGSIREVSLVLAGANEGAYIDNIMAHGDGEEDAIVFYNDSTSNGLSLSHSSKRPYDDEEDEDEDEDVEDDAEESDDSDAEDSSDESDDEDDDEKKKKLSHADEESNGSSKTIGEIFNSLNDEQKTAVYAVIGAAVGGDDSEEEDNEVKHNVFDNDERDEALVHADFGQIMADYKRFGSLKAAVEENAQNLGVTTDELVHADTYGVKEIETLFPDAKFLNGGAPEFIKRETDWVPKVLNGTHHSPFSRIKSRWANITEDEARAKGYLKGHLKTEEVFSLLKRSTDPQTVYKKQKLDRDDIIDITDFDVVAWIKAEMRMMLDEELARAILVGDGRLNSDENKIHEDHIRPIWKDADLFTVKCTVHIPASATDDDKAKAFIKACIKSRKFYKGSGTPTMFTTEDLVSDSLLVEDGIGHTIYDSENMLATKCRVSSIVTVPVMEGLKDTDQGELAALIVNLRDYNVGADRGGAISLFDDFDIDYNQQKYLIETRCSGALTVPYSAIAISFKTRTDGKDSVSITFSDNGLDEFTVKKAEG